MISIGCGADSNPQPRGKIELAQEHGGEVAAEVERLLPGAWKPLAPDLQCREKDFSLPFQPLPTRQEWEERAKKPGIVGYHARVNLQRLDRHEALPTSLPYSVVNWTFGSDLAMVFLAGEVVVDYSIRLKKAFDPARLWINAYANDVPCYIPSVRVLNEGGYEAEDSLWYYDRPARLAPESEDLICEAVSEIVPPRFRRDEKKAELRIPQSPKTPQTTWQAAARP
jgi:hypothetical protein